jgi:hypothetical protein
MFKQDGIQTLKESAEVGVYVDWFLGFKMPYMEGV